jgi:hypothetical protein
MMKTIAQASLLLSCSAMIALGDAPAPAFKVDCRGFGTVEVARSTDGALEITEFKLRDAATAMRLASKRKRDLQGFGDLRAEGGGATVLSLDGVGAWGLGVVGEKTVEIFGSDADAVRKALAARALAPVADGAYPRYLDCFDNAAAALWISGGGQKDDLPFQFEYLRDQGLAMCTSMPGVDRLLGPGIADYTLFDYNDAMARKYGIGYRQLLFGDVVSRGWFWNRYPLPYALPAEGFRDAPYCFRSLQALVGYYEPTGFERYEWDFRRRLAERYGDPEGPLLGWHGCDEIPTATITDLSSVARTPIVIELWKRNHEGDVPVAEDFLGPGPKLDLRGKWELRHAATDLATEIDSADMTVLLANSLDRKAPSPFTLRRTFTAPDGDLARWRFLHSAVAHCHGSRTLPPTVTVNGVECPRVAPEVDWSFCYDLSAALRAGENEIVLDTRGANLPGYCFLNATPLRGYFDMTEEENRRFFEAIEFSAALRCHYIEGNLRAIRSVDPERPIKLMATHSFYDHSLALCRRYGAYQHDTGGAAAFWAPMQGDGYSRSHRLPFSCEQGGPPQDAAQLRANISRYLNYGNSAADLVFSVQHYTRDPEIRAWLEENIELVHALGKMRQPAPRIAVLRSTRMERLGFHDIWDWDIGRGTVQATGRTLSYIETCDLADPDILDQLDVIVDDATFLLTDAECEGLKAWVERGGTFVAQHHTGRHSIEKRDAWPLPRVFGIERNDADATEHPIGNGRLIRLGTPRHALDATWFAALFDRLDIPRDSVPPHPRFWGEAFESKNGLYDLYLATYMTSLHGRENIDKVDSFRATFRRAAPPREVRDFGVKGHPRVDAAWADGAFSIPEREYAGMESKLYAVPADDPGGAACRWIRAFAETWHPVETVEWTEPAVAPDPDRVALDSGWIHNGREVDLGTYATMGIPENEDAAFSRTVAVPEAWKGRRVELVYDARFWFWGLYPAAELDVNGRPAALEQPIRPQRSGSFALDVTEAAATGNIRLDLRILPSLRAPGHTTSPTGSTGLFLLVCHPPVDETIPLDGPWFACLRVGEREPVRPGETKVHNFYETTFTLPESARGKRIRLRYSRSLSGLALNGYLLDIDKSLQTLDITGLVRFDGPNTLRLVRWVDRLWPSVGAGVPKIEDCNELGEASLEILK